MLPIFTLPFLMLALAILPTKKSDDVLIVPCTFTEDQTLVTMIAASGTATSTDVIPPTVDDIGLTAIFDHALATNTLLNCLMLSTNI